MTGKDVVIIGGGLSGALVALQLARQWQSSQLRITIVEKRSDVGPGLAYTVPSDLCKLNVPADQMGAFPEDPAGFFNWVKLRERSITGDQFVTRRLYGEYLKSLLEELRRAPPAQLVFTTIKDEAIDISPLDAACRYTVTLASGSTLKADLCALALGNIPRASFAGLRDQKVLLSPYDQDTYRGISECQRILIIGSSLTAVDAVLEAKGRGFRGEYTLLSRHGRLPLAHEAVQQSKLEIDPRLGAQSEVARLGLNGLTRLVISEALRLGSSQPVIAALRPNLHVIWSRFSMREKSRFLRLLRPIWEIHRHRIPRQHHDTLNQLMEQRKLSLVSGRIRAVSAKQSQVEVKLSEAHAIRGVNSKEVSGMTTLWFDRAILCAGPEGDLAKVEMPLIKELLHKGGLRVGTLGLGVSISYDFFGAGSPHSIALIGPLQREDLWEITAVREIRAEAAKIAKEWSEAKELN